MKKKLIKILSIILYFIFGIIIFIEFLNAKNSPDAMGLNFAITLLLMPISIFSIVYGIISIVKMFKNKIKITIIDKLIMIFFVIVIIFVILTLISIYSK